MCKRSTAMPTDAPTRYVPTDPWCGLNLSQLNLSFACTQLLGSVGVDVSERVCVLWALGCVV